MSREKRKDVEVRYSDWRSKEESIDKLVEKYPDIPKFVILKTDLHRRGYILSERAKEQFNPEIHHGKGIHLSGETDDTTVEGLYLRDGTAVCNGCVTEDDVVVRDPYIVDYIDGKLVITDQGRIYEEAEFWYKPDYYDKFTSKGTPMWKVLNARGHRLDADLNQYCEFWDIPGGGCKYCGIGVYGMNEKKCGHNLRVDPEDVYETLREALKQRGRYLQFRATQGSLLGGKELLDEELEVYLATFSRIKTLFKENGLKATINTTAMNVRQLERLRDEGGVTYYTSDIEVLDKEKFEWICPGKAKVIGYDGWKKRLYDAVDVFGKGHVSTDAVLGTELATPKGFRTEDEAIAANLRETEELAKHGVIVLDFVWRVGENTIFKNQKSPSLDYYIRMAKGINEIRESYGLSAYFADYQRSGNQPSTDLARI